MEFGLFSNGERSNPIAAHSYAEDIAEIVAADRLGFAEAWISEHAGGNRPDSVVNAEHIICKAAGLTKRIRLGPGIRVLPLHHPVQVASEAASCDHVTNGRYMAGFGGQSGFGGPSAEPGGPAPAMVQRGSQNADMRARMEEAADFIVKCWTTPEPFDYEGQFWSGKGIRIAPRPLQKPHMPVGLACSQTDTTLQMAGRRGFLHRRT